MEGSIFAPGTHLDISGLKMSDKSAVKELYEALTDAECIADILDLSMFHETLRTAFGTITVRILEGYTWLEQRNECMAQDPLSAVDAVNDSRLDWLQENEAWLVSHRERWSEGWTIWWNVVKRGKSISGHPLGNVRDAIDAAILKAKGGKNSNG